MLKFAIKQRFYKNSSRKLGGEQGETKYAIFSLVTLPGTEHWYREFTPWGEGGSEDGGQKGRIGREVKRHVPAIALGCNFVGHHCCFTNMCQSDPCSTAIGRPH